MTRTKVSLIITRGNTILIPGLHITYTVSGMSATQARVRQHRVREVPYLAHSLLDPRNIKAIIN